MIGGDRVTEIQQNVGIYDVINFFGVGGNILEEGRIVDIGGRFFPVIGFSGGDLESVPGGGTLGNSFIDFFELFRINALSNFSLDFISGWPDIFKENVVSRLIFSDGFGFKIDINVTSKSVCNN